MMNIDKYNVTIVRCSNCNELGGVGNKLVIAMQSPAEVKLLLCGKCLHKLKLLISDYYEYILGEKK